MGNLVLPQIVVECQAVAIAFKRAARLGYVLAFVAPLAVIAELNDFYILILCHCLVLLLWVD